MTNMIEVTTVGYNFSLAALDSIVKDFERFTGIVLSKNEYRPALA